MLEAVRLALRLTTDAFDAEITDLIAACKLDLQLCGIVISDEDDKLFERAVVLYCKANFGFDEQSDKFGRSYDMLKASLQMSGDYNGGFGAAAP